MLSDSRHRDPWPTGMGLNFTYMNVVDQRFLARSLVNHPPRLPGRRKPPPLPTPRDPVRLTLRDITFLDEPELHTSPWCQPASRLHSCREPLPWAFDQLPPMLAIYLENDLAARVYVRG